MRKKVLNVVVCFVLLFFISGAVFACQNVKNILINNMNRIASCTKGASYGTTKGFIVEGIENGQCHYKNARENFVISRTE